MKTPPSPQKLQGGYYTPAPLADFLVEWAITSPSTSVLEPSCGDGAFLEAVVNRLLELGVSAASISSQIAAVEINLGEADKAGDRLRRIIPNHAVPSILKDDFFELCEGTLSGRKFDAVVGNPPFGLRGKLALAFINKSYQYADMVAFICWHCCFRISNRWCYPTYSTCDHGRVPATEQPKQVLAHICCRRYNGIIRNIREQGLPGVR